MHGTDVLRFIICGSVDDGKSTMLGRLLYDAKLLLGDTVANLEKVSHRKGLGTLDLSLLTDGLQAEREQGITIDVAYRYFSTGGRKFISADAPGHEQYTRNMVTGCSTADLAIILVDVTKGVVEQTLRHLSICKMLHVPKIVVAINKMDLVLLDSTPYFEIRQQLLNLEPELDLQFIPTSAINGSMVVHRSDDLSWYKGPTILELLTSMPIPQQKCRHFRMPVQYVARHDGRRLYMGRIESGVAYEGMPIQVFPSGQQTTVTRVHAPESCLELYQQGDCVAFELEGDHDVSRGDLLSCLDDNPPRRSKELQTQICWFGPRSISLGQRVLFQHGTRIYQASLDELPEGKHHLKMNDISYALFRLAQDIHYDLYADCKEMGAFIILDPATNTTIGAGTIKGGY